MDFRFLEAHETNLKPIIALFLEDELGQTREELNENTYDDYLRAFHSIKQDKNQNLQK